MSFEFENKQGPKRRLNYRLLLFMANYNTIEHCDQLLFVLRNELSSDSKSFEWHERRNIEPASFVSIFRLIPSHFASITCLQMILASLSFGNFFRMGQSHRNAENKIVISHAIFDAS